MMNECGCKLLNSESKTSLNLVGYLKKFSHGTTMMKNKT